MPRIKNDLANHLAASMDARVVKTAMGPMGSHFSKLTDRELGEIVMGGRPAGRMADAHYEGALDELRRRKHSPSVDEEGVTGETCPMTGKPIWECECPECTKKMLASEEGTDEPAEGLSVEEELMRLESMRTQMRKTAIKEPSDEHWKIRAELLRDLHELKMKRTEIEDKLNKPELVKAREEFKKLFPGFPNISGPERRKAASVLKEMLGPSIMLMGELEIVQGEMDDIEERLQEMDAAFAKGEPAPVEVKLPPTAIAPEGDPMFTEGLPRPVWGPMVGQAQKAIRALTKISETLDRAGLAKSAYATLRTAQVLQKEIKEG
jgi:hypothetical protein